MGRLRIKNKDRDPSGAVVNGVRLGVPADIDGRQVYDDPRIPSGEVEAVKDNAGKDKAQPPGAVKHGDVYITPDVE